jgi:hypothetical protein
MTYDVSGEKRRVVVGAAARLAASQYAFAEALIGAETAGLSDARVATLLGVPEPVVGILRQSWNLEST